MDAGENSRPTVLQDGTIAFIVRRKGREDEAIEADLWLLKMAMEAAEDAEGIRANERGELVATPELFLRLASVLPKYGITDCTPSMAGQIWHAVHAAFASVKKNTSATPN